MTGAYEELLSEGYLEGRHGSGTYVAAGLPAPLRAEPMARARWLGKPPPPPLDATVEGDAGAIWFRMGAASVEPPPPATWRAFWHSVGNTPAATGPGPGAGDPALRRAIARYLGRARGIACSAEDVIVTSGASQAIDLVVRAIIQPGDRVGYEEPGYPSVRGLFVAAGARLVPVPVDENGLVVERIPAAQPAPLVVVVTPSHQYPLGVRMSVGRRLALLAWAEEHDALVLEDDYDSEYRFDAPPLPALAGLGGARRVVYAGTFSKVLAPALRVGYLVVPPALRERTERLIRLGDYHPPLPIQEALATFIEAGQLDRHIRRMRRTYAEKRVALRAAMEPLRPGAELIGLEAGLHACLIFRDASDPDAVAARARERGVIVSTLDNYYLGLPDRRGLVLGYGGLDVSEITEGGAILCEVIRSLR